MGDSLLYRVQQAGKAHRIKRYAQQSIDIASEIVTGNRRFIGLNCPASSYLPRRPNVSFSTWPSTIPDTVFNRLLGRNFMVNDLFGDYYGSPKP